VGNEPLHEAEGQPPNGGGTDTHRVLRRLKAPGTRGRKRGKYRLRTRRKEREELSELVRREKVEKKNEKRGLGTCLVVVRTH